MNIFFIFDTFSYIFFPKFFGKILPFHYVERQIARIPYDNPTTAAQMQEIKKILQDYFCARINTRKK